MAELHARNTHVMLQYPWSVLYSESECMDCLLGTKNILLWRGDDYRAVAASKCPTVTDCIHAWQQKSLSLGGVSLMWPINKYIVYEVTVLETMIFLSFYMIVSSS